jgi:spermidine/putrescine-binding protein
LTNDVFAIPKGAPHPVLAHAMIDFLLDAENALTNYSYEGFQPPIVQFDNDQAVSDGIVPGNLANTLLTEDDFNLPNAVRQLGYRPRAACCVGHLPGVTGGLTRRDPARSDGR